jgi:uncharacterized damage-inducible protein DinB
MTATQVFQRLHEHRQWATRRLLAAAGQMSAEQLRLPFEIGQGSIWRSLTHMYAAEFVWLEALTGNDNPVAPGDVRGELPGNQMGDEAINSLDALAGRWAELDERWNTYLAALDSASYDELVYKANSQTGERYGTRRSDVLLHVCTHAQYTTAQAINMLRQVGASNLPDPMLISLARESPADRSGS